MTALGTVVVVVEALLVGVVSAGLMQPTTGAVGSADGAHTMRRLVEVVVVAAEAVNAGALSHNKNTTSEDVKTVRRIVSTLVTMCPC